MDVREQAAVDPATSCLLRSHKRNDAVSLVNEVEVAVDRRWLTRFVDLPLDTFKMSKVQD
ncbi:hypothetical protein HPL003_03565 [Paenibacillus terrae HPL-003]|uniref:Uncharacterized protein n=1 Tax=Paenibacillus terrae (strain HPL-003) TaxID=985665 RepID=G7VT72_PAETH|nr:hypothetical protein HPL003_03565 [Paenibacillus terrae HPL-003]